MSGFVDAELWLKLALAFGCGAAIGLERELNDKPAGLRTNLLICVGSTLITMTSIHVALTYAERQVNIADPGRIAAQIVSGVGFLGAGTIIQARGSVHGLTTAATIWVMAGIGLAIGSGYYVPAAATTVVLIVILSVLGLLEARLVKPRRYAYFQVTARRGPGLIDRLNRIAAEEGIDLDDFRLSRQGDHVRAEFAASMPTGTRDALLTRFLDIDAVEDVRLGD